MIMMLLGLKIFVTGISLYAGIKMLGIGCAWLKEYFDQLKPESRRRSND